MAAGRQDRPIALVFWLRVVAQNGICGEKNNAGERAGMSAGKTVERVGKASPNGGSWSKLPGWLAASKMDPEHWRERASEARARADQLSDREARSAMLGVVTTYIKLD